MRRIGGHAPARFGHQLVEQHPLRRARLAAQFQRIAAQVQVQRARADRVGAAVQAHHRALAGDEGAAGVGAERGEADAFHPCDRDQHRFGVVGQGHVELRAHRLVVRQGQRAVDGGGLAGDLLDADLGDAAEQCRGQRPALGLHHGDAGRRAQAGADRADHPALDQHVGIGEGAASAGGVHGGAADQYVLGEPGHAAQQQAGGQGQALRQAVRRG
ncbi:hypothetical protein NB706_002026 [Xanthomonas sacchari]|nr:hypothetical protein [Xanthomonas sacchari]